MKKVLLLLAAVAAAAVGCSKTETSVSSPDGNLQLTLSVKDGSAGISIDYKGCSVVGKSPVGFEFKDGCFGDNVVIEKIEKSQISDTYDMPFGKQRHVESVSNQVVATLNDGNGRCVRMYLRAFDDAVAYRCEIPMKKGEDSVLIKSEKLEMAIAGDPVMKAMTLPDFRSSHENVYTTQQISLFKDSTLMDMPAMISFSDGNFMAVTEAMVIDYAGMMLTKRDGQLCGVLSPRLDRPEYSVISGSQVRTPWRVFQISDRVGAIMESTVLTSLCDPCTEKDLSWLKPGKATWMWWNGYQTPEGIKKGDINTVNYNIAKYYIDFCKAKGIDYYSITGIVNENMKEFPWYMNGNVSPGATSPTDDARKLYPGFEIEPICRYARENGVGMRVWVHWKTLNDDIEGAYKLYSQWGIDGMMIDFMNRDDQQMIDYEKQMLELAMKYHLHIQFHGASKPSGLQRTYPCEFTRENTLNYEVYKWDWARKMGADHDLSMPFTRCLAGPTDYHLGGFRSVPYDQFKVVSLRPFVTSTRAHMLGMYVVLEGGLQLVSDAPEAYENQDGFDFIQQVPVVWDQTVVPAAEMDKYVVFARRNGKDWYIGAIGSMESHDIKIPLSFLGDGKYKARMYSDADDTDTDPNHINITEGNFTGSDTITIHLQKAGGFTAILKHE